jgi:hypothetical protein
MKVKLLLAACAACMAAAACTAHSPTAARALDVTGPARDGVGTFGSGGFVDTTVTSQK